MSPNGGGHPTGLIADAIESEYGGFENFQNEIAYSIFYEICNNVGYCQQGYIYVMVYESNDCDLNTIPEIIYTKTLEENTKDVYTIDLTTIICPLDEFVSPWSNQRRIQKNKPNTAINPKFARHPRYVSIIPPSAGANIGTSAIPMVT